MSVNEAKHLGDEVEDRKTEQGFTPGPWKAVGYSPGWWQIEGPEGEQIADVNYSDGADEPTLYPEEANARLIAAAPALYEACKTMLASLDGPPTAFAAMLSAHRKLEAAVKLVEKSADESAKRPVSDHKNDGQASKSKSESV